MVAVGAGAWIWKTRAAPAATSPSAGSARPGGQGGSRPAPPPLDVSGVTVRTEAFAESIVANGTLRAEESIELQTEVNGKVVALNFEEGQRVTAGQVLVKIDDSTQQANLRRTQARRALAALREQRLARLVAEGGVSQLEFDQAQSEIAVIDAELEVLRAEIAKTEIRAPFDGVAGLRFISLGAYVNPATRIATLQGTARLKVDFSVPERYATLVSPGDPVRFTVAGTATPFTGQILAIEPRIDIATRSILLRALCNNPDGMLVPGSFARVEYTVQKSSEAVLVPAIALISGLEERFLFVVRDGVARRVTVTTGARTASRVQILEGLAPGDIVITSGVQQLRPGLPVKVRLDA